MQRALALIDGEHYPPVVKSALEELPYDFVAAHVVGGKFVPLFLEQND